MRLIPPDAQEVRAARAGDSEALQALMGRSLPCVLQWCARMGGPRVDAEDAAHDVMVVVLTRLHTLAEPELFGPWLFGITRRVLASHRRKRMFESWIPDLLRAGSDSDPHARAEMSDLGRRVQSALDALSVDHREVLVLIDIEERTEREVADLLSLPVGTVRSRVHRARQSFLGVAQRMKLPAVVFERVREGT